jgi:hypothetical protein
MMPDVCDSALHLISKFHLAADTEYAKILDKAKGQAVILVDFLRNPRPGIRIEQQLQCMQHWMIWQVFISTQASRSTNGQVTGLSQDRIYRDNIWKC